jgi:hypothetical protein
MTESHIVPANTNIERMLPGTPRPYVAMAAFGAVFFFAGFPFLFDTDNLLIAVPCIIACLSAFVLFLHLLVGLNGDTRQIKYMLLGIAAYLAVLAGRQWYLIALITCGTVVTSFLIARLLGPTIPVIRPRGQ